MKSWSKLFIVALTLGVVTLGTAQAASVTSEQVYNELAPVVGAQRAFRYTYGVNSGQLADRLNQAVAVNGQTADALTQFFGALPGMTNDQATSFLTNITGYDKTLPVYAQRALVIKGGQAIDGRVGQLLSQRSNLYDSDALQGAYAAAALNCAPTNRVWVGGLGVFEDFDGDAGYTGYKYKAGGMVVGYDHSFGNFDLGASVMYAKATLEEKGAWDDNSTDNYGFSLYGTYYHPSGFFGSLKGGYIYGDNDMQKFVYTGMQNWSNHTNTWWAEAKVGYNWRLSEKFTLTPSIGLMYLQTKQSAFTTYGAGVLSHVDKMTGKSMPMPIDLAASYRTCVGSEQFLTFTVKGGYAYDFKNDPVTGTTTFVGIANGMPVTGFTPGQSSWNVGAGVHYEFRNFDVGVDYLYEGKSNTDTHRVLAQFGVKF